jgi:hypothetical protein
MDSIQPLPHHQNADEVIFRVDEEAAESDIG